MRYILIPFAALLAFITLGACMPTGTAQAAAVDPLHLEWRHATERVDGTPLPLSDIVGYRLYYVVDGELPTDSDAPHILLEPGTETTVEIELAYRLDPYLITAALRTVDRFGQVSALSNSPTVTRIVQPAAPGAPTSVQFVIVTP